jgi:riboflavin transporter FmnP
MYAQTATFQKTRKLTTLAVMSTISYVLMVVGRIPMVLFLKYDPKDIVITFTGFLLGPLSALAVSVVVSFVEMFTVSDTGFIGLVMNILSTCAFSCTAAVIYQRKRTQSRAVIGLVAGTLLMTAVMLLWNCLITPLYLGVPRSEVVALLIPAFLPFNLIKGGLNATLTLLLYKPACKGTAGCLSSSLPGRADRLPFQTLEPRRHADCWRGAHHLYLAGFSFSRGALNFIPVGKFLFVHRVFTSLTDFDKAVIMSSQNCIRLIKSDGGNRPCEVRQPARRRGAKSCGATHRKMREIDQNYGPGLPEPFFVERRCFLVSKFLFTSESVTEGHPDKICDQISDAILDFIISQDPTARVACETVTTTGLVFITGEISTDCYVDIPKIARQVIKEIGYNNAEYGFDGGQLCGSHRH